MKTFVILNKFDPSSTREINVNDDEMIVYDVCKIADYEGGDYVPREAKKRSNHLLPINEGEYND